MLTVLIRSVVLYLCIMLFMRLMGKRQLGELQPAELVISVKADGTIHYQDRQLTKEALAAVLETRPEALLNLYVDEKAPFEAFVGVVDIARLKRGGHFVISTQPSER